MSVFRSPSRPLRRGRPNRLRQLVLDFRLFLNEACQGVLFLFVEVSKPFLFASHETAGASGYDVMKAARPAVQRCWPYQSVNMAPSWAMRSMFGCLVAHDPAMVNTRVEPADIISHDHENVGFLI